MSAAPADGRPVYLHSYLAPLAAVLERGDVTDVYVNRPGEYWVETTSGQIERHDAPGLSETTLDRLYSNDQTAEWKAHLGDLAGTCTANTDDKMMDGGAQ